MLKPSIIALAGLALATSSMLTFAADKPSDPQIAHIAYTAGEIDIEKNSDGGSPDDLPQPSVMTTETARLTMRTRSREPGEHLVAGRLAGVMSSERDWLARILRQPSLTVPARGPANGPL